LGVETGLVLKQLFGFRLGFLGVLVWLVWLKLFSTFMFQSKKKIQGGITFLFVSVDGCLSLFLAESLFWQKKFGGVWQLF
jgi:hypothetical protein